MIDSTLKNANILIVDDQEANIDVLEGLLEMQGYSNIKSTVDPREVISLHAEFNPDLILLDLSMPYLSGFEVMELLNSNVPDNTYLPILILTADVTSEAKQRALSAGATDFLTKPFDLVEVGLRIKNILYTSFLHQQLLNQNQILDIKVKQRTFELEKMNIELMIAKEKAESSNRLKTSFLNNISHEIRTPLNGILGFGQILSEGNFLPEEKNLYLTMLNNSSDRLIDTVTNFLDISLLNSGSQDVFKKEINPEDPIITVMRKFEAACYAKNISFTTQLPSKDHSIKMLTDSDLLYKILYQLIDNAVKFTKEGTITVGYERHENEFHYFVKDSGIGITEEVRKSIFGHFIQEDSTDTRGYEGSGLGLAVAKGFVELLGGNIWLDSEKGKGSTFYFSLPGIQQATRNDVQNAISSSHTLTSKLTLLVAEDNDINFILIKLLLKDDLIEIFHASNGLETIELCHQHPEINLILMDLKMPEMDGFEATRQIKSFRRNLPIIAVSAYTENEVRLMAMQAGCDDFITKPINKEIIFRKLREFSLI